MRRSKASGLVVAFRNPNPPVPRTPEYHAWMPPPRMAEKEYAPRPAPGEAYETSYREFERKLRCLMELNPDGLMHFHPLVDALLKRAEERRKQ